MLFDDLMGNVKTKARPAADDLGGKKWLEYILKDIIRNPCTRVLALYGNSICISLVSCFQEYGSVTVRQCLYCILDYIHKNLTEICKVAVYFRKIFIEIFFDDDSGIFVLVM